METVNNGDVSQTPDRPKEEADHELVLGGPEHELKGNVFKTLQSKIGSDVTNITLPVFLCEPTTTLQRMAEVARYADLLNEAADLDNALERLAYVAAFYLTSFSGTERFDKPFNPVLGETFEHIDPANGAKVLCEQVSHHPPISVSQVHNDKFVMMQSSTPKAIFGGNSVELDTQAQWIVQLPRTGDRYSLTKSAVTKVHNILIGFAWIDHFGPVEVTNTVTGDKATLQMEKCGFLDKNRHVISGQIRDASGNVHLELSGKWTQTVSLKYTAPGLSKPRGTIVPLWTRPPRKVYNIGKWKLTPYALKLIEITPDLERLLPSTDSRLRPDRRLLAEGHPRRAGDFKSAIENRQRRDQKEREAGSRPPHVPRWFQRTDPSSKLSWEYAGGYWEERQKRADALNDPEALAQQLAETSVSSKNLSSAADFRSYQHPR